MNKVIVSKDSGFYATVILKQESPVVRRRVKPVRVVRAKPADGPQGGLAGRSRRQHLVAARPQPEVAPVS